MRFRGGREGVLQLHDLQLRGGQRRVFFRQLLLLRGARDPGVGERLGRFGHLAFALVQAVEQAVRARLQTPGLLARGVLGAARPLLLRRGLGGVLFQPVELMLRRLHVLRGLAQSLLAAGRFFARLVAFDFEDMKVLPHLGEVLRRLAGLGPGRFQGLQRGVGFAPKPGQLALQRAHFPGGASARGQLLLQILTLALLRGSRRRSLRRPGAFRREHVLRVGNFRLRHFHFALGVAQINAQAVALRGEHPEPLAEFRQLFLRGAKLNAPGLQRAEPLGERLPLRALAGQFRTRLFQLRLKAILLAFQPLEEFRLRRAQDVAFEGRRLKVLAQAVHFGFRLLAFRAQLGGLVEGGGQLPLLPVQLLIRARARGLFPAGHDLHRAALGRDEQRTAAAWAVDLHTGGRFVHGDLLLTFGAVKLDVGHSFGGEKKAGRKGRD